LLFIFDIQRRNCLNFGLRILCLFLYKKSGNFVITTITNERINILNFCHAETKLLNFGLSILIYMKNVILRHQRWTQYLISFFSHKILNKSCRIFQNDNVYISFLSESLKMTLFHFLSTNIPVYHQDISCFRLLLPTLYKLFLYHLNYSHIMRCNL